MLLAAGISHSVDPVPPSSTRVQGWSPDWLVGTTLDLVSETQVLTMRFGQGAWVAMTSGQKGGPLTGPLLPWRIEHGKLFIGDSAEPKDGIELVSLSGDQLVIRMEGKNETYKVSR